MNMPTSNPSDWPATGALEQTIAARAWAHGWAISRSTPAPLAHAGYWQIQVGKPEQVRRYVLPELDPDVLRRLVATAAGPGVWLKVCAPPEDVAPLLSGDWTVHAPEFLMSTPLAGQAESAVAGYLIQTGQVGAIVVAQVVTDSGELAAGGQAAIDGAFATFDQIVTSEAHRRKGLGRCVMAALARAAVDRGARHGVLVATEAGAALYQALGWAMVSPVTAASCSAAAPAA
ncbi:GNAT family N-acetyltransferase [Roseateles chitinivorans]|uniref:GNAT family N-acetyltransferase n=1 Tax=Roseateles chitinivorans TaxID=2917965 RepID=UPI003D66513F